MTASTRSMTLLAALILCAGGVVSAQSIPGCSTTIGGNLYDLSPMYTNTYYTHTATSTYTYDFNVCGAVSGLSNCPGMMCQYKNQGSTFVAVIASWTSPTWSLISPNDPNSGLTFTMQNGSPCNNGGVTIPRVSIWNFPCDPAGSVYEGMSVTNIISNLTTCSATYTLKTSQSCVGAADKSSGGSHGLSGGWVFIIILCVTSVLYCAVGAFIQHRKGATGTELCPNRDFWFSFPGLVKEGCRFSFDKVKSLTNRGGGASSYSEVA